MECAWEITVPVVLTDRRWKIVVELMKAGLADDLVHANLSPENLYSNHARQSAFTERNEGKRGAEVMRSWGSRTRITSLVVHDGNMGLVQVDEVTRNVSGYWEIIIRVEFSFTPAASSSNLHPDFIENSSSKSSNSSRGRVSDPRFRGVPPLLEGSPATLVLSLRTSGSLAISPRASSQKSMRESWL